MPATTRRVLRLELLLRNTALANAPSSIGPPLLRSGRQSRHQRSDTNPQALTGARVSLKSFAAGAVPKPDGGPAPALAGAMAE